MAYNRRWTMNFFYVPALAFFAVFVVFPFFDGIRISFTDWNGFLPHYNFVGLDNYRRLIEDRIILEVFINTIIYGFGSTLFQNLIGLGFALYLNAAFVGRGLMRTIIYVPVLIAPLIMGYVMFFLLQFRGGALNDITALFGQDPTNWLGNPTHVVLIITIINTLQYAGISMVIYLAGLQNIPAMYKEAASIDGATPWSTFRLVTLPLLRPAITSAVMINLIGGLKLFDIIRALLPASPASGGHSLSTYLTFQYFNAQRAGYSAAIGVFTLAFIFAVSMVAMRYFDRKEEQMI